MTRTTMLAGQNPLSPRVGREGTTGTGAGVGAPVPAVVTGYDPHTGLVVSTATDTSPQPDPGMAGELTTGYDDFGRTVAVVDADGARTTTSYDPLGRIDIALLPPDARQETAAQPRTT